jgi:hypothetical protein
MKREIFLPKDLFVVSYLYFVNINILCLFYFENTVNKLKAAAGIAEEREIIQN